MVNAPLPLAAGPAQRANSPMRGSANWPQPAGGLKAPMVALAPAVAPPPKLDAASERDRANAKLPPPPEEDSALKVLLRPGLLADVEITVEKTSDSIYVPNQAIFEKDGKQYVWVQDHGGFQQRFVRIAKRSE